MENYREIFLDMHVDRLYRMIEYMVRVREREESRKEG